MLEPGRELENRSSMHNCIDPKEKHKENKELVSGEFILTSLFSTNMALSETRKKKKEKKKTKNTAG